MNRLGRAAMMLAVGGVITRLLTSGNFGWFVQQRMRWPLIGAAIVMLVFGISEALTGAREEQRDPEASRYAVGPKIGWMLMLPLVVLLMVAPTGLGAAAAGRVDALSPAEATDPFAPLEIIDGQPVAMSVFDFLERALWDDNESLDGVPVRLEGLVVNDPELPTGFKLTRFSVSCCAADGIPLQVNVLNTAAPLPNDSWVVVDLTWKRPVVPYAEVQGFKIVEADAISVTLLDEAPNDAYESPY